MAFRLITQTHSLRRQVEHQIRKTYCERFSAQIKTLPALLVASEDGTGGIECAAGIRFTDRSLFSECYLDSPVERVLKQRLGCNVRRAQVVEICNLVARKPGCSLQFISDVISLVESLDAHWAIFTATRPLRSLLRRNGIAMTELARADRNRVPNPSDWGTYYKHDPWVMAVGRDAAVEHTQFIPRAASVGMLAHA